MRNNLLIIQPLANEFCSCSHLIKEKLLSCQGSLIWLFISTGFILLVIGMICLQLINV